MRRVHVGLDLEDHAREFLFFRLDDALHRRAFGRSRCQVNQRVQHFLHAEVVDGRAEEHRRLAASQKFFTVEFGRSAFEQLQLVLRLCKFSAKTFGRLKVVQTGQDFIVATGFVGTGVEHAHALFAPVIDAVEQLAHADRPGEGNDGHAELLLDLVHDVHRVLHLAVHLVDESQDGRVAGAANLQQAARLRLDAVGRINHHQGGIDGGQHAVGVFGKILVAGRVQQVDDAVAVFHLHDRAGDGNAALLFDFHPVGGRVARGLARLDAAGDLNGAREQQQLFGQRGFTRVGVGNDGKRAAALDLFGDFGGFGHNRGLSVTRRVRALRATRLRGLV